VAIFCYLFVILEMIRKIFFDVWLVRKISKYFFIFSYNLRSCKEERGMTKRSSGGRECVRIEGRRG